MPTLNINGQRVQVDDSFLQLSPEQQNATVEEIAQSLGRQEPYSGSILPLSRDAQGNVSFDSDAGILGSLKRAFTLPGDVMAGEVDPTSQEGIGRALEFATTFSPATAGMRAGERIIPGEGKALTQQRVNPPTVDQLYEEAGRNFDAMRDSGVDYASSAVKSMAEALKGRLDQEGFDAEVASKTHRILDKLASPPEGSVANIRGLHSARKTFGKIAQNFNDPTDQAAASQAIRGLDDFITGSDPSAVVAGSAADAAAALKAGNANYAAAKRSDLLTGIERAADLRAAAANSGANTGNSIRQRVASALLKPKQVSGFSPEEVAALEGIVEGSTAQNATRYVGNLLGGGGGLGQMLTTAVGGAAGGATAGAPGAALGAAIPLAVGAGSKELSNILTARALKAADAMVRSRSPLYDELLENAPMQAVSPEKRAAIVRALLLSQQANGGGGY